MLVVTSSCSKEEAQDIRIGITMKTIAAKINSPAVQRFMLMFLSFVLGVVTCVWVF